MFKYGGIENLSLLACLSAEETGETRLIFDFIFWNFHDSLS